MLGCFGPSVRIGSLSASKQMFTEKTTLVAVERYLEAVLFLMLLERDGDT